MYLTNTFLHLFVRLNKHDIEALKATRKPTATSNGRRFYIISNLRHYRYKVSSIVLVFLSLTSQLGRTDVTHYCMQLRNQLERSQHWRERGKQDGKYINLWAQMNLAQREQVKIKSCPKKCYFHSPLEPF